ncbi:DYNC1H1 [Bugula neritina]|uniref:DYNC1H1 n=1 Tax=Bugula neritina TaxID=10212 RepID=A0A7J7JFF9_BUGNE|nr:DYNC1H1 [Bugula neritina]
MQDVILVCQGEKKATNHLRQMNSDLTKGIIPQSWKRYTVPAELTVIQWITDFTERIKQFQAVSKASQTGGLMALKNLNVWLGGLFVPEAYITATRQYVAQANSWSLEELSLQVTVTESSQQKAALDVRSFGVTGLSLHGATCTKNVLSVSSTIQSELPLCLLSWVRLEGDAVAAAVKDQVTLPVYLNPSRAQLLFTLNFSVDVPVKGHNFYERGVALTCSKLG